MNRMLADMITLAERKNQREGKSFRPWHAILKSLYTASLLRAFVVWPLKQVWKVAQKTKKLASDRSSSSRQGGNSGPVFRAGGTSYTKVAEGDGDAGAHSSNYTAYNPGGGLTTAAPWPADTPRVFGNDGTYLSSPYGRQQQRSVVGVRYEPMGYSGAKCMPPSPSSYHVTRGGVSALPSLHPDRQQPIITGPIQQTGAVPLSRSRSPSPAPSSIMTISDPPPYPGPSGGGGGMYSNISNNKKAPGGDDTEQLLQTPAPLPRSRSRSPRRGGAY